MKIRVLTLRSGQGYLGFNGIAGRFPIEYCVVTVPNTFEFKCTVSAGWNFIREAIEEFKNIFK